MTMRALVVRQVQQVRVLVVRSVIIGSRDIIRRNYGGPQQGMRCVRMAATKDYTSSPQLPSVSWLLLKIYSELLQDFQANH
jgi:hypothetical protein